MNEFHADSSNKKILKLLYCIPTLFGGGAERQVTLLAPELARQGCHVEIALLKMGPNAKYLEGTGIPVTRLKHSNNYDLRILYQLVQFIRRLKPDLVQTWLPNMDVWGGLASIITRTPFIISERNSSKAYPSTVRNKVRLAMGHRYADAIIANSRAGLDYWAMGTPTDKPQHIIRNVVPLATIDSAEPVDLKDYDIPEKNRIVLFAGRFVPNKNLSVLFASLKQVVEQNSDVTAIVCGDGIDLADWKEWIQERHLQNRIRLMGYVDNLWQWMKRADMFISTSMFEGQPNTVLEAMACECPLVVSDIPEHCEFLDMNSALIIPRNDSEAFADAISGILASPMEAQIRATRARKIVEGWSPERIGQQYIDVYLRTLYHSVTNEHS